MEHWINIYSNPDFVLTQTQQPQTERPLDLQLNVPISLTLEEWYVVTTRLSGIRLTTEGNQMLIAAAMKMARTLEESVGISEEEAT